MPTAYGPRTSPWCCMTLPSSCRTSRPPRARYCALHEKASRPVWPRPPAFDMSRLAWPWTGSGARPKAGASSDLAAQLAQLARVHTRLVRGFSEKDKEFPPLVFPKVEKPVASIVIPVHNKFYVTYHCLASLLLAPNQATLRSHPGGRRLQRRQHARAGTDSRHPVPSQRRIEGLHPFVQSWGRIGARPVHRHVEQRHGGHGALARRAALAVRAFRQGRHDRRKTDLRRTARCRKRAVSSGRRATPGTTAATPTRAIRATTMRGRPTISRVPA